MSAVKSRDFLSLRSTQELIQHVRETSQGIRDDALVDVLSTSRPTALPRFSGTVDFLICAGWLYRDAATGRLLATKTQTTVRDQPGIQKALAASLIQILEHEHLGDQFARGLSASEYGFRVNMLLVPQALTGAAYLLFEYGVLSRNREIPNFAYVGVEYETFFLRAASRLNRTLVPVARSLQQLRQAVARQEEQGKQAEEWVLAYEKARLHGHVLLEQVCRVSEDFSNAGFDIVSFSSLDVMTVDRYIEVKSYHRRRRFFWSSNEMKVAEILGENYQLYLVDMEKIRDARYMPLIISGPYSYFFGTDQPDWVLRPNDYYFEAKEEISPAYGARVPQPPTGSG